MERMQAEMDVLFETINRLSEQTQAAGDIIASVNDLAEQSNLLSVNASIEAAKAGEYGQRLHRGRPRGQEPGGAVQAGRGPGAHRASEIQKASQKAVQAAAQGREAFEAGRQQSEASGEVLQKMAERRGENAQRYVQVIRVRPAAIGRAWSR